MPAMLMLMLQASVVGPPAPAIDFDLRTVRDTVRCGSADGADIIACAALDTAASPYRLPRLPPGDFEPQLPLAAFGVFDGGTLAVEGDTATFPGGVTSNRAMIRLKMKF